MDDLAPAGMTGAAYAIQNNVAPDDFHAIVTGPNYYVILTAVDDINADGGPEWFVTAAQVAKDINGTVVSP